MCSKVGAEGYLDACGVPEPMKSEMLAAVDVVEMKRLGGGKVGWYFVGSSFVFLNLLPHMNINKSFCSRFLPRAAPSSCQGRIS